MVAVPDAERTEVPAATEAPAAAGGAAWQFGEVHEDAVCANQPPARSEARPTEAGPRLVRSLRKQG